MPRFVVLEHDHPFLHWDLMLEVGDTLRTWRLLELPALDRAIPAEPLGNHRKMYLDYEGRVSGERGTVKRCDSGIFEWERDEPERVVVRVEGQRLGGTASLVRDSSGRWSFLLTVPSALSPSP
jgi:hypothetical protein